MTPLLLLHGYAGHPDDFGAVAARLPAGSRALAEPIYGHRGHPETGALCFEDELDRLASRLRELALPPLHVAGYSLGGRLALGLVARHPALVARATLIGSQPGLRTEAEREARRRADAAWIELLERQGVGAFAEAWEAQPLFASQRSLPAAALATVRARRRRHDPFGLAEAMRRLGLGAMPDLWPALPRVRVPVTLVHGELDSKFGGLAQEMAASLPSARVVEIPKAGHNPVLERPEAILELLCN